MLKLQRMQKCKNEKKDKNAINANLAKRTKIDKNAINATIAKIAKTAKNSKMKKMPGILTMPGSRRLT